MSQTIGNRLNKLEDEIRSLLTLQRDSCTETAPKGRHVGKQQKQEATDENYKQGFEGDNIEVIKPAARKKLAASKQQERVLVGTSNGVVTKQRVRKRPVKPNEIVHSSTSTSQLSAMNTAVTGTVNVDAPQDQESWTRKLICKETQTRYELEVKRLKFVIEELKKNRAYAFDLTREWKERYLRLKNQRKSQRQLYEAVLKEKKQLTENLSEDRSKMAELEQQIEQLETQNKEFRMVSEKYYSLLQSLAEKDEELAKVTEMCNELQEKCEALRHNLEVSEKNYQNLKETNQEFAKNIVDKYNDLKQTTSKADHEVERHKEKVDKLQKTITQLSHSCINNRRKVATQLKNNNVLTNAVEALRKQLISAREKERTNLNEIRALEEKVRDLETSHRTMKEMSCGGIELLSKENKRLQEIYVEMQKQLEEAEKSKAMLRSHYEAELDACKKSIQGNESLLEDKDELRQLADELSTVIRQQKERISDLLDMHSQQKVIMETQERALNMKDEELRIANEDIAIYRRQYGELENHIRNLRICLDSDERTTIKAALEREVTSLRQLLEDEIDKVRIKDKVLDDHAETIAQLKKKLSEKEVTIGRLCKEFNGERRHWTEMDRRLEEVENEKNVLEQELARAQENISKQEELIGKLEKKIVLQQQEWSLERQVFNRERDQAIRAAKFATAKLNETVCDFQRQSESQCNVRNALANMLQEKDEKMKTAILQMSSLTFDPDFILQAIGEAQNSTSKPINYECETESSTYLTTGGDVVLEEIFAPKKRVLHYFDRDRFESEQQLSLRASYAPMENSTMVGEENVRRCSSCLGGGDFRHSFTDSTSQKYTDE